jgi:hypothetical protein
MYDNHEDAVQIAFYYDWNREVGNEYRIVALCSECAGGRDVIKAGDPSPGEPWRCEDCDARNHAELELEEDGVS